VLSGQGEGVLSTPCKLRGERLGGRCRQSTVLSFMWVLDDGGGNEPLFPRGERGGGEEPATPQQGEGGCLWDWALSVLHHSSTANTRCGLTSGSPDPSCSAAPPPPPSTNCLAHVGRGAQLDTRSDAHNLCAAVLHASAAAMVGNLPNAITCPAGDDCKAARPETVTR